MFAVKAGAYPKVDHFSGEGQSPGASIELGC